MNTNTPSLPLVLVTGASGFLGRHVVEALRAAGHRVATPTHDEMNIADAESVKRYFAGLPAVTNGEKLWVVHCAALSSTAYCKDHPDESMAVNVEGTLNVAQECARRAAHLIYCSSDQVYSGCTLESALSEDLPLEPNNVYGAHKLLMEEQVKKVLPSAIGLRLTWMYATKPPHGIVKSMQEATANGVPMRVSSREHRGMTPVRLVAGGIVTLIEKNLAGGIYNFGCPNSMTTLETLQRVVSALKAEALRPQIAGDDSWTRNLAMDTARIEAEGIVFPSTLDALLTSI